MKDKKGNCCNWDAIPDPLGLPGQVPIKLSYALHLITLRHIDQLHTSVFESSIGRDRDPRFESQDPRSELRKTKFQIQNPTCGFESY